MFKKIIVAMTFFSSAMAFANDSHYRVMEVTRSRGMSPAQVAMARDLFANCRILFRHVVANSQIQGELVIDLCKNPQRNQVVSFKNFGQNSFRDTFYKATLHGKTYSLVEPNAGSLQIYGNATGKSFSEQTVVILDQKFGRNGYTLELRARQ